MTVEYGGTTGELEGGTLSAARSRRYDKALAAYMRTRLGSPEAKAAFERLKALPQN
jgi:hypothetical protein